jgi:hypothetical protein
MADKTYVSARDGENNSVIYKTAEGAEFLHSGGTRAWRNNNPGNLIGSEKSGRSIDEGIAALKFSLTNFYSGRKLDEVFKKYAPAADDNDPEHYIVLVKKFSGLDSTRTIGSLADAELDKFIGAIERVEGWKEGKVEAIPHAQQFVVKGVDDKPLCGLDYEVSYLTCKGEEKKLRGKTDDEGKTGVAVTDTRAPVTLKLPRPDPGQSLKGTGTRAKPADQKQVIAAEVKAKPWYAHAFSRAADSEDEKHDGARADQAPAAKREVLPTPEAPVTTVKQTGAVQASITRNKVDNHVEEVIKGAGVYVTWEFDTTHGSGKKLDGLPYIIAEMNGTHGRPLVAGQRVCLMKNHKIRAKVPFGTEVALYLGNDAKLQYRTVPLYRVKAEEGLTDVVVKVSETKGNAYIAEKELPSDCIPSGTKKTFSAKLYGATWMKFSHRFTEVEAAAECVGESPEMQLALKQIYGGAAIVGAAAISLNVIKPNKKTLKILWQMSAFSNCKTHILAIAGLGAAKDEIIPRVHPQTYKAFLKAAFEMDLDELTVASGWRPMLGSVLHRIGVGLDVGSIKFMNEDRALNRSATAAEQEYRSLMVQKKELIEKKARTDEEDRRLNEILAIETAKANAADKAIQASDNKTIRDFIARLRANGEVRQTFDPWEMDANTADGNSAAPNRLISGNEALHRNHLHITVRDPELGY